MGPTRYEFDQQLLDVAELALLGGAASKDYEDVFRFTVANNEFFRKSQKIEPMRVLVSIDILLRRLTKDDRKLHSSILGGLKAILEAGAGEITSAAVVGQ